jgi:hypothetical protein
LTVIRTGKWQWVGDTGEMRSIKLEEDFIIKFSWATSWVKWLKGEKTNPVLVLRVPLTQGNFIILNRWESTF